MNLYSSIREIPAVKYYDAIEKNDYTYLMKKRKAVTEKEVSALHYNFMELFDQYIEEFGLPGRTERYYELKKKVIIKLCDSVLQDDRMLETQADVLIEKMNSLIPQGEIEKFRTVSAKLNKLGFSINPVSITLYEYLSMLEAISDGKAN